MLIQTQRALEKDKIFILKLSSGEEVIGKVDELGETEIFMTKVYRTVMTQEGVGIAPFSVLSDTDVVIPFRKDTIIAYYPPSDLAEKDYLTSSTGISLS